MPRSNLSEKLIALAKEQPQYTHCLTNYADALDDTVEDYCLEPCEDTLGPMLHAWANAHNVYFEIAERKLLAD